MNNRNNTNTLSTNTVYDTAVSYDELPYCFVLIFWNYPPQSRMSTQFLDNCKYTASSGCRINR